MKINIDTIVKILQTIQSTDESEFPIRNIDGMSDVDLFYHTKQLKIKRLIEANILESGYPSTVDGVDILGITLEGDDFLSKISNEKNYHKLKESIIKTSGVVSLDLILAYVKTKLNIS